MSDGPSVGTVFFVSALTSALVSAGTVYGLQAYEASKTPTEEVVETVGVPEVVGLPMVTAKELLSARGLRLFVDGEKNDPEIAANHVMEQNPLGGSEVKTGDEVHVSISLGVPQVSVPELVGKPLSEGRAAIEKLGLKVGTVSETGEGTPEAITATQPPAGEKVEQGSEVAITAVPAGIVVPDLSGKRRHSAGEALEEVKLKLGKVRRHYNERRPDQIVLSQDPEAGTRAKEGTEVSIVINE